MTDLAFDIPSLFSSIDDLITDFSQGKMVIMVDDPGRENEGDLFIAADFISAEAVNFMRVHGSGVICLVLSESRCEELGLSPMVQTNTAKLQTAFTVSIDAAKGISTGVSAKDRAYTLALAAKKNAIAADFAKPGHIFPLSAKKGGVLRRAGHTEAAHDLALLAGVTPAVALVEIVNEDGSMARGEQLWQFALRYQLKIGAISDLVTYRQKNNL